MLKFFLTERRIQKLYHEETINTNLKIYIALCAVAINIIEMYILKSLELK